MNDYAELDKRALEILHDLYIRPGHNVRYDGMEFVIINDALLNRCSVYDTECDVIWIWVDVVNIMKDFDAGHLNVDIPKDVFFREKDFDWRQYIRNYSYDANTVDYLAENGCWDRDEEPNYKRRPKSCSKNTKQGKADLSNSDYPWKLIRTVKLDRQHTVCDSVEVYEFTDRTNGTTWRLDVLIDPDNDYRTKNRIYTLRDGGFLIGEYSTLAEAESHIGDNFVGFKNPAFKGFKPVHKTKNKKKRIFKKKGVKR